MFQLMVTSLVYQSFAPLVPKIAYVMDGGDEVDAVPAAPGVSSSPPKARRKAAAWRRTGTTYGENTNELPPSTLPYLFAEKTPKPGHTYHR
jgi:hypothetical protein